MARIYMLFTKRRIVFYAIGLILITALCRIHPACAQGSDSDPFTVKGVKVDVTAESAADAREQAFAEAQQKAFRLLAERLLSQGQVENLTPPEPAVLSTFIKDFEVTEERISRVRYVGTYTFRFLSDAVRNYMSVNKLAFSDVASKPVLILPYYQWGARTLLWGEQNPWLAAWNRMQTYQGLVPVLIPIGDLDDVADIGENEALTYSPDNLANMTKRYGAGETIIMLAMPEWQRGSAGNGAGVPPDRLTVMVYRTDRGAPEYANKFTVTADQGDVFETAVREARQNLQQAWKNQTAVDSSDGNNLKVRIQFAEMNQWLETQKALRRVQGVNEVKLLSLKPDEAHVELAFQGSEERLRLALAQADMTLTAPQIDFGASRYQGYGGYYNSGRTGSPLVYDLYLNKYRPYR